MADTSPILCRLFDMQDTKYRDFQSKLIPNVSDELFIGIRTPNLRKYAKELYKAERDPSTGRIRQGSVEQIERFLPYVDNWATCDQMSPGIFKKNHELLLPYIRKWICSGQTYTVRFAIGMLMQHFLDHAFDPSYPEMVAAVQSEEYYVRMMIAWYFATALAKQYDTVLPYIENKRLEPWTHNKTIQKAVESYRITPEQKTLLKALKLPLPRSK